MNILLINSNPVVARLISLCTKELNTNITHQKTLIVSDLSQYDAIFIDDKTYTKDIENILNSTHLGKRILLASKNFDIDNNIIFDHIIKKPFLPSQILEVLLESQNDDSIFDLEMIDNDYKTQILDNGELSKIKDILDDNSLPPSIEEIDDIEIKKAELIKEQLKSDGVEIINQDEYINNITKETKKSKKYKKALKKLIDNAIEDAIDRYGKDNFKQAVRYQNVTIDIQIKE